MVLRHDDRYIPPYPFSICDHCNTVWGWNYRFCRKCYNILRREGEVKGKWGERQYNVKIDWLGNPETANIRCEYCESPLEVDDRISKYSWIEDEKVWKWRNQRFAKWGLAD